MHLSAQAAKTIIFVCFVGPGPVIGLVPWTLSGWQFRVVSAPLQSLGALLVLLGALPLADSIIRFVREGRGTPAPYAETDRLIVTGFYRHVRNPMYVGVLTMIFGQALLLWNASILRYALIAALFVHLFVLLYEEPRLRHKYRDAYIACQKRVNRWLPHFTKA
jgi:protein-S-isoprenylcysteine O-methyltransferase Ste14